MYRQAVKELKFEPNHEELILAGQSDNYGKVHFSSSFPCM